MTVIVVGLAAVVVSGNGCRGNSLVTVKVLVVVGGGVDVPIAYI